MSASAAVGGSANPGPGGGFEAHLEAVLPRAYQAALHMTGNPADAEEVVQEAAMLAYRGFDGFEPGTNFKAWFLRIVTNAFLMRCRREKRTRGTLSLDESPHLYLYERTAETGLQSGRTDPAAAFFSRLDVDRVSEAIAALPAPYRAVASLYFVEDLSYAEISDILRCPVGTVRSRLHRARAQLQRSLWDVAVEHGLVPEAVASA